MKKHLPKLTSTLLSAACAVSSVSCYYPARGRGEPVASYSQDSKGGYAQEPMPRSAPGYVGVDPALAVAGVAAAGLLGYAIGNNHSHHSHYYGPRYYRPVGYGYYGRGYCR
ncbi:hypothetical protein JIN84_07385 [Luteolibacter yonseiensis]|uniref:Lipoprotein n=1 Tax=Luteolibacter yonseiensis TaxID=1144680 RepID=A0A934R4Q4_9BACT|nr:hypothetical protein [Luteolibacter yonseiensis]MBK1815430.1 hypothetical protein [Luteolibacter yonseiensis]